MNELTLWFTDEHANSARELTRIAVEQWPICLYRWNDRLYVAQAHTLQHSSCAIAARNYIGIALEYRDRHRLRT